jgi:putative glycosyltransferase (TIGR04348 family)
MATIGLIYPETETLGGNRVTAQRWSRILRGLSWQVFQGPSWDGRPCDALVALHARKSHDSIVRFARAHPDRPLIVAGAGTDLYTDVADAGEVRESLGLATRIVLLQPLAIERLAPEQRDKARVIYQSVRRPRARAAAREDVFEVALLANVRPVKDPLCAVRAARLLPAASRVRILHLGAVIDEGLARELEAAARDVPGYVWLGARPRVEAIALLARSRIALSTSRHEGGANALSEALACDVPVIATRIPGALGILGEDYPGTFPVGDAAALAELLARAETDVAFLERLRAACRARRWLTDPATEVESWRRLLDELLPRPAVAEPPGAAPR